MKIETTNIVLILRKGGDFKFTDVYLLVAHINKYWTGVARPNVYCYTDATDKEQSVAGMTIRPLPEPSWKGWWSKMNLFGPGLKDLRPFLYLDLDTVVLNSLTRLIPKSKKQCHFITLRDFYRVKHLASGVMWIPKTPYPDKIYREWAKQPEVHMKKFRGDQNFIESVHKADSYWQNILSQETVTTFKPNKKWRTELPVNSTVVCFHGTPRVPEAAQSVQWVKDYVSYVI